MNATIPYFLRTWIDEIMYKINSLCFKKTKNNNLQFEKQKYETFEDIINSFLY